MINAEDLAEVSLFHGMKPEALDVLTKNLRPLAIDAGENLVEEGLTTRGPLMIVTGGLMEVKQKDSKGEAHTLVMLEPPTVIGEMEFLADIQANATVSAHDDVSGYLLPRARFEALLEEGEPAAYHLALAIGRLISERLAETNRLLTKALSKNPDKMVKVQKARMAADLSAVDAELDDLLKL